MLIALKGFKNSMPTEKRLLKSFSTDDEVAAGRLRWL